MKVSIITLTYNSEKTISENTEQFFIQDNNKDIIIEEDPIIRRLGYQFILAKCIKYIDNHNFFYVRLFLLHCLEKAFFWILVYPMYCRCYHHLSITKIL